MRLLFLTAETCPTYRADVAALFGKYLPRHGVFSDIVAGRSPDHSKVEWGGGETYLFDIAGGQARKHIKTLLHGIKHLFMADRSRYQAIQVRDMPVLAAFGLLAARIKGLPFYYWMSYPMPEGQIDLAQQRGLSAGLMKFLFPWVSGRVGKFLLYRVVLQRADHVFVQSEHMKADMVARGISPVKMTPVPMGVDLETVQLKDIPPAEDPRLKGRRVLVYLGTLDRPRRIEVLFEMLAHVSRQMPEVLLVLAGDTADDVHRSWLKQQAAESGVADAVLWTGWLPMQEGWRYVRAAEVALSPIPRGTLLDCGSPTKVPEYLALGVPVVCNDNPDQEKVIRESGAGLCVPYTAESFAEAVLDMLRKVAGDNYQPPSSGRDYVKAQRSYEHISLMTAGVYESVSRK
jgi:glycosyltransferase involved in cell wall biosynthesis